jgi:hypothetical protein
MLETVEDPIRSVALIPRLAATAAATGSLGGAAAALLYVGLAAGDGSPGAHLLGILLTGAALAVFACGLTRPLGADPRLVAAVGAAMVASALAHSWSEVDWTTGYTYGQGVSWLLFVMLYGAVLGLVPAGLSLAVAIGVLLLLRILGTRVTPQVGGFVVVAISVALTAAFATAVTVAPELPTVTDRLQFVGLTTAFGGLGAILGARWALLYRPHE